MANALLYYLIVINILTFAVYGIDKWKAKQGSWRISEATLLMLAVIGGTIGALFGMYNPQNEMFARFQTKRSIQQNEMSSQLPRKSLFSSLT